MKWSGEQQEAIDRLIDFVNNDEPVMVLTGYAGTGKTSVMNEFVQYLDSTKGEGYFQLCAPTHKAKLVLRKATGGYDVTTLHSLLSLSPNLNIFNLDYDDLKFESGGAGAIPYRGLVIVDEASMISDDLYDLLLNYCSPRKCKILFIGDIAQLRPVDNDDLSKVFSNSNIVKLTKIFRQDEDTALIPILSNLRKNYMTNFEDVEGKTGSLITYTDTKKFMIEAVSKIRKAMSSKNPNYAKLIAYTNNRVNALNRCVRRMLFKDDEPYHVGEILMGCENFSYNRHDFFNSSDYIITSVKRTERKIPNFISLPGFDLMLYDEVDDVLHPVFMLDVENINPDYLDSLAQTIENVRLDAISAKNRGNRTASKFLWKKYYDMMKSFATPIPLMFDNRVVKPKTFMYGYAITVHKSQGSSYNSVFVDMSNLLLDKDTQELRQLQYVALSRTQTDAHLLL